MKKTLVILTVLFCSCWPAAHVQKLVVLKETPEAIFYRLPTKGIYGAIVKDSLYVDYHICNWWFNLQVGDLIAYSRKYHRVVAVAEPSDISPSDDCWLELNYDK